jgi:hypothetical protein
MILGVGIDRVDLEEFSRMPEREGNNTSKHVYTPWKKISYCRLTVWNGIPGAGHYLPEEKPEYLTAELLRLLRMSEAVGGTEGRSRGWRHSKRYLEPQESFL